MQKPAQTLRPNPNVPLRVKPEDAKPQEPRRSPLDSKRDIPLDYPVDFAGEHYTQLVVRRLKAKDFRALDALEGGGNAQAIAMAALVCNVSEGVIDELDAVDYFRVQEAIADFFPRDLVAKYQAKVSPSSPT